MVNENSLIAFLQRNECLQFLLKPYECQLAKNMLVKLDFMVYSEALSIKLERTKGKPTFK